jgi:hypothetical protein
MAQKTSKTTYNDAKEFKRLFMESLKGQYNPSNDRLKFTEAADAYIEYRVVAAAAGTVRLEKERLRAVKKLLAQIATVDLKLKTSISGWFGPTGKDVSRRASGRAPSTWKGKSCGPF